MSDQSIVEVTQADRDAAEAFFPTHLWKDEARADVALAFARHRIAEREACAMVAERIGECANTSGRSGCCETTGDDIAAAIRARS